MQGRFNPDAHAAFERLGADAFLAWALRGAADVKQSKGGRHG